MGFELTDLFVVCRAKIGPALGTLSLAPNKDWLDQIGFNFAILAPYGNQTEVVDREKNMVAPFCHCFSTVICGLKMLKQR